MKTIIILILLTPSLVLAQITTNPDKVIKRITKPTTSTLLNYVLTSTYIYSDYDTISVHVLIDTSESEWNKVDEKEYTTVHQVYYIVPKDIRLNHEVRRKFINECFTQLAIGNEQYNVIHACVVSNINERGHFVRTHPYRKGAIEHFNYFLNEDFSDEYAEILKRKYTEEIIK